MSLRKIIQQDKKYVLQTYNRKPLILVKGKGIYVWDIENNRYFDFFPGWAVNNLGHCYPAVVDAINKQSKDLLHISNTYYNLPQTELAKMLCDLSFADKVFFCNSGAEANESAIKLARKYAKKNSGNNKYEIITMLGSFHGRTMAALSATGQKKYQQGFEPLLKGFKYVPFNDFKALKKAISEKTCAIMLELIQGEGGVNSVGVEYLKKLHNLCKQKKILLIFDEVQTGIGRTGKMFAYQHFGIKPDIMTLAKALGGGVPIGAMLTTDMVAFSFKAGDHASTFGGNPLACAAAIAVLKTIKEKKILKNTMEKGDYFFKKLEKIKKEFSFVKDVRGKGLMLAMELNFEGEKIVEDFIREKVLINCTQGNILRFMPSLIISKREIDVFLKILKNIFKQYEKLGKKENN